MRFLKRNKVEIWVMAVILIMGLSGCREADRVSYNISLEADNFNTIRQITVINCIQGGCTVPDDREDVNKCRCTRQSVRGDGRG